LSFSFTIFQWEKKGTAFNENGRSVKLDWYMAFPALIYPQYEIQANKVWKNV